ncbi:Abi family protein [Micrococcus luteus]|nr:Abi family protein [Micrococcus luteus]
MGPTVKKFLTYEEQLDQLIARGMVVDDYSGALKFLRRTNYYRLSGYWYPFRKIDPKTNVRSDEFYPETHFDDVVKLYYFDASLRVATFSCLSHLETAVRALLGHALGQLDPVAHLNPALLGPVARNEPDSYNNWRSDYMRDLQSSREDFVTHHDQKYGGVLPVWAAVEILNWGSLSRLYNFSPHEVKKEVAAECGLTVSQMYSWLKTLNLLRNDCAHHKRVFNRVGFKPRLPPPGVHPQLDSATTEWTRTFAQLTLIQFLMKELGVGNRLLLPSVLKSYPHVRIVPLSHIGAPVDWATRSDLWKF